jgi:Glutamyl-tRNAGlu reductase, dimerisation domain
MREDPEGLDSRPALLKALRTRCEAVCQAEVQRLAHRAPTLTEAQQRAVGAALDDLVERLLLSRMRHSDVCPALVAELFRVPEQHGGGQ